MSREKPVKVKEEYERRKRAEKQAHAIVEKLITQDVEEDFFLSSLNEITGQYYNDITEERSLSSLCGYCLCQNTLKEVPRQQYKISQNRVYDITERKKFCSNRCYAISCRILEQISTTPLWSRDAEKLPVIKIPKEERALNAAPGEEVQLRFIIPKDEVGEVSSNNEDSAHTRKIDDGNEVKIIKSCENTSRETTSISNLARQTQESTEAHRPPKLEKVQKSINVLQITTTVLQQWLTHSTLEFLGVMQTEKPQTVHCEDLEKQNMLQKQLDRLLLGKESDRGKPCSKSMPFQEDFRRYGEKVAGFYGSPLTITEKHHKKDNENDDGAGIHPEPTFPIIDTKDQELIRQRIVLDHVKKLIDQLTPPLPNVIQKCRLLVKTFRFNSKNVMLSAESWPVMTIYILYLLSINDQQLRVCLESEDTNYIVKILLEPYGIDPSSIKRNVSEAIAQARK